MSGSARPRSSHNARDAAGQSRRGRRLGAAQGVRDEGPKPFVEQRRRRRERGGYGQRGGRQRGRRARPIDERRQRREGKQRVLRWQRADAMHGVAGRRRVAQIGRRVPGLPTGGAQLHVVGRIQALDLVGLEQRSFDLARGLRDVDVVNLREQLEAALARGATAREVTRHAFAHARRLAHVEDVAAATHEAVNARTVRQRAPPIEGERVDQPRASRARHRLVEPGLERAPRAH